MSIELLTPNEQSWENADTGWRGLSAISSMRTTDRAKNGIYSMRNIVVSNSFAAWGVRGDGPVVQVSNDGMPHLIYRDLEAFTLPSPGGYLSWSTWAAKVSGQGWYRLWLGYYTEDLTFNGGLSLVSTSPTDDTFVYAETNTALFGIRDDTVYAVAYIVMYETSAPYALDFDLMSLQYSSVPGTPRDPITVSLTPRRRKVQIGALPHMIHGDKNEDF